MTLLRIFPRYVTLVAAIILIFIVMREVSACPAPQAVYPDLALISIAQNEELPTDYIPTGLIDLGGQIETNGSACFKESAAQDLIRMFEAAAVGGVELAITSAYAGVIGETYQPQGEVVGPGLSEHQLGTAVDLTDASIEYSAANPDFDISKGGRWMKRNAHKYGFVISHSKIGGGIGGISYEPWHWRYVGPELARKITSWRASVSDIGGHDGSPIMVSIEELEPLALSADAFTAVYLNKDVRTTLISKNENLQLPIASISKLVTAIAIKEYYKEDAEIVVERDRLSDGGSSDRYRAGDRFKADDLLHSVLIESDNDAVTAFANALSEKTLVEMMNHIVRRLGINDTIFYTATGLDFWNNGPGYNLSTANELVTLVNVIMQKYPEIMDITRMRQSMLYDASGNEHHLIQTTNELLSDPDLEIEIMGGKTGSTPKAKENLVLAIKPSWGDGSIIGVVLGSDDHFADMKSLINWAMANYQPPQPSSFSIGIGIIN